MSLWNYLALPEHITRRGIFVTLFIVIAPLLQAQTVLQARFDNLPDGSAYLFRRTGSPTVDTVLIRNHTLQYATKLDEPTLFYLVIDNVNTFGAPIRLVLSSKPTTLSFGSMQVSRLDAGWKNQYPNRARYLTDPNDNALLDRFEQLCITFSDSIGRLTPADPDNDTLFEKRKALYEQYLHTNDDLVSHNADKVVTPVAIFEFLIRNNLIDLQRGRNLFWKLSETARYSATGGLLGDHINRESALEPGHVAPDFELKDNSGRTYTLSTFNKKILLHFWSSICGPCREENPEVAKLQADNKDNLVVINISLDADRDKWIKAIDKDGLKGMVNVSELKGSNTPFTQRYYLHGIPAFYLISPDKIILGRGRFKDIKSLAAQP
jgi:thiol-disulfide isomerase/thioredoxin